MMLSWMKVSELEAESFEINYLTRLSTRDDFLRETSTVFLILKLSNELPEFYKVYMLDSENRKHTKFQINTSITFWDINFFICKPL